MTGDDIKRPPGRRRVTRGISQRLRRGRTVPVHGGPRTTPAGCRGCVCPGLRTRMPAPGRSGLRGHTTAAGVPSVPKLLPGCSPGHSFGYFSLEGTSVRQAEGRCRQARSDRPGVRRRRVEPMVGSCRGRVAALREVPAHADRLPRSSWSHSSGIRGLLPGAAWSSIRASLPQSGSAVIREWDASADPHHRAAGGDWVSPPGLVTGLWLVKTQVSRYSLKTKDGEQHGKSRRCMRRRNAGAAAA